MNDKQGFTLIELLISLVVLGIIISIAYPSYQDFIIKSRRTNAQTELLKAQMEQSNHRILQPSYVSSANLIGLPSNDEHYTFTVISASTHSYLIKAEVKKNSPQHNDKADCKTLVIDQNSNKTKDGHEKNNFCW